jgi:16S rRNA (cytidine1402-2'-O)-methyltransferase
MPYLYIVATPIGNLEDISLRALRILKEVDLILCEDTRVTRKLLAHYQIKTPTLSYHQHSKLSKVDLIIEKLKQNKNLALVTDAGTPGISDPGGKLISQIVETLGKSVKIIPIPGPTALTAALSIAGVKADRFLFLGFLPHKKGRQKFLQEILKSEYTVVVYESKHRLIKFLEELKKIFDSKSQIQNIIVCRELTKLYETIYRGSLEDITERIKNDKDAQKGEFVIVIGK